jgi:sugar phosphate isomerase/epimerase
MRFPLACADFTFPLLTHAQALRLISMIGVEGVDIGLFEGRSHLHPSRELEQPAASGAALGRQVADCGLHVADVFLQMDPDFSRYAVNHPDKPRRDRARDWFRRTLDYARACRCGHVTALPGVLFDGVPAADSLGLGRDELAWRVEQARSTGVVFGVEAHVGSIVPTPRQAQELVAAVPGLTLTLDYTHFTSRGTPDAEIEPLIPRASHFHARGARSGRLQCSFKENVIDYRRVVQAMQETRYNGYIGIEYVWIDWEHCNEVDNVSETILFRDFFRTVFGEEHAA